MYTLLSFHNVTTVSEQGKTKYENTQNKRKQKNKQAYRNKLLNERATGDK